MMISYNWTGGIRTTWINATAPFARLVVDNKGLEITVKILFFAKKYSFRKKDITRVEVFNGWFPFFSRGIKITNSVVAYPSEIIFWHLGNQQIINTLSNLGYPCHHD